MDTIPRCASFESNGFMLQDLDTLRAEVFAAVRMYAVDQTQNVLPTYFFCSHDNAYHDISMEEIKNALFYGPGSGDFAATYNELMGLIQGTPVEVTGIFDDAPAVELDETIHESAPEVVEPSLILEGEN